MEVKVIIMTFSVIILYLFYLMYFVTSSEDNFDKERRCILKEMRNTCETRQFVS